MRIHRSIMLALVLAAPAAALAWHLPGPPQSLCLSNGTTSYRIVSGAQTPDYTVQIDNAAPGPDLRIAMVDDPGAADLVLVDETDGALAAGCASTGQTMIHIGGASRADVTVSVADDLAAPDYRIFMRSTRFAPRHAAAMLAVMWKSGKTGRLIAQR